MTTRDEAEQLAVDFHNTYERIAAGEGWETNADCRVEFDDLPDANRATMLAACGEIHERWVHREGSAETYERADRAIVALEAELQRRDAVIAEVEKILGDDPSRNEAADVAYDVIVKEQEQ